MSALLTYFYSEADNLVVIDLALNIYLKKRQHHDSLLVFDDNIMVETLWIDNIKEFVCSLTKKYVDAQIGISMQFIHSCKDNGAFLNFAKDIPDASNVFFYNILPGCDFQTRILSDLAASGVSPEFDKNAGVIFLTEQPKNAGKNVVELCEKVIMYNLGEAVREIISTQDPPEMLASSNVYADHYVDIKRLFMKPDDLLLIIYYMSRWLITFEKEYDAIVATSKNGAVLAGVLGKMTGKKVIYCVNIGPQYALPTYAVRRIQEGKRYIYVYDFMCLGTEAKLLHTLVTSRCATLVGGIGVASYIPLDNPELREKNSPLANIDSLVNLISAKIDYHICVQKKHSGSM